MIDSAEIDRILSILGKILDDYSQEPLIYKEQYDYESEYTNLQKALGNIELSKDKNTPLLDRIALSCYQNNLFMIDLMAGLLQVDSIAKEMLDPSKLDNSNKIWKLYLGKLTFGIFNDHGGKYLYYPMFHPESWYDKLFNGVLGVSYCAFYYNNIPYQYDAKRLRIGTQIQQYRTPTLHTNVPNNFKNYIIALNRNNNEQVYKYLYINLQKRNDGYETPEAERRYEHERSIVLHNLEQTLPGIAVVTLPADNKFFFRNFDKHKGLGKLHGDVNEPVLLILDELITSIEQNHNDFYLSKNVKDVVFGKNATYAVIKEKLMPLFKEAILETTISNYNPFNQINLEEIYLSPIQRQAMLFHFVKHKFTNYLIQQLNPVNFNISCKDAIDRAGVHNAWNIICSKIEINQPVSLAEFEKLINIPAILVKDRPINEHVNALCNILGHYYYHASKAKQDLMPWVPQWLNKNSPYKDQSANMYKASYLDDGFFRMDDQDYVEPVNPLYDAVNNNDIDEVRALLKQKNISLFDDPLTKRNTVLLLAAQKGYFEIFNLLLDQNLHTEGGHGIRSHKLDGKYGTALNYLIQYAVDNNDDTTESSIEAICHYMQSITHPKTAPRGSFHYYTEQEDEDGATPIYLVAASGRLDILEKLAQYSYKGHTGEYKTKDIFNLNHKNTRTNKTPIQIAAENGHPDVVPGFITSNTPKNR